MKDITLGILAHVDAGKTTLSESLLYGAGNIQSLGRVDHQNAFLDTYALERARGITIFSKQAMLQLPDTRVTILDTPGHMDFSAEMERTLQVLDYCILVVSATDGVQSHTETVANLLAKYHIPTFVFVNKINLPNRGKQELLEEIQKVFSGNVVEFGDELDGEQVALCDEALMEHYLETGELPPHMVTRAIGRRKLVPCYFCSALKLEGIKALLEGLNQWTEMPLYDKKFGARVYKISFDNQGTRLTHLKITGGSLKVKAMVFGKDWQEKVNQIRLYSGVKFSALDEAQAGTICAVTGLSKSVVGDGYGEEQGALAPVITPVLTYRVQLPEDMDDTVALGYLRQLEQEDPQLQIRWDKELGEIHIQLMGAIQIEILQSVIAERFGFDVAFDQGNIVYRETIASTVIGSGHFEPLRHYAEVHLKLEPQPQGTGIVLDSQCPRDVLPENFQNLVFTHLMEKSHGGPLTNSAITDLKITLMSGRAHLKHTEGGDFREATYRALRQGLMKAEKVLLEPYYKFQIQLPTDFVGRALTDIDQMGGVYDPPTMEGDMTTLQGRVPVSTSREYQRQLVHFTKGRGRLAFTPGGYGPCQNQLEIVKQLAYDPERDSVDTGNSVFCEHGAGRTIPWQEADDMMHIKVKLQEPKQEREVMAHRTTNITASDSELLAIFERTYGKIDRDPRLAMVGKAKKKKDPEPKFRGTPIPKGPEYLLVDGYNIIFAWEDLAGLAREGSLNAARHKLMDILVNYAAYRQCNLILVFDAYKVKGNPGSVETYHNIHVVYTKEAETADMYIEKTCHNMARQHRVSVATSDNLEQMIIWGSGALRISALEFEHQIREAEKAMREYLGN